MNTLKQKVYRFISSEDQKELVDLIVENTTAELLAKLGAKAIPKEFVYIIESISIKRYNRLSNEGMKSISKDNVAISYLENDFLEYEDQIKEYKRKNNFKAPWRFL